MERPPILLEIASWVGDCATTQSMDWKSVQAFISAKMGALSPQDRAALEQQVKLMLDGALDVTPPLQH